MGSMLRRRLRISVSGRQTELAGLNAITGETGAGTISPGGRPAARHEGGRLVRGPASGGVRQRNRSAGRDRSRELRPEDEDALLVAPRVRRRTNARLCLGPRPTRELSPRPSGVLAWNGSGGGSPGPRTSSRCSTASAARNAPSCRGSRGLAHLLAARATRSDPPARSSSPPRRDAGAVETPRLEPATRTALAASVSACGVSTSAGRRSRSRGPRAEGEGAAGSRDRRAGGGAAQRLAPSCKGRRRARDGNRLRETATELRQFLASLEASRAPRRMKPGSAGSPRRSAAFAPQPTTSCWSARSSAAELAAGRGRRSPRCGSGRARRRGSARARLATDLRRAELRGPASPCRRGRAATSAWARASSRASCASASEHRRRRGRCSRPARRRHALRPSRRRIRGRAFRIALAIAAVRGRHARLRRDDAGIGETANAVGRVLKRLSERAR